MIQEYLVSVEEDKEIIKAYSPPVIQKRIQELEGTDCIIATFSLPFNSKEDARKLSGVHEYVIEKIPSAIIISSGCSEYYNKVLYPLFNAFERKLRKLLALRVSITHLDEYTAFVSEMEQMEFGAIFNRLFYDSEFMKKAKIAAKNYGCFSKEQILSDLQNMPEQIPWDIIVGKDVIPTLRLSFDQVRIDRNDVMHAHNITLRSFQSTKKRMGIINKELDSEIEKYIKHKITSISVSIDTKKISEALIKAFRETEEEEISRAQMSKLASLFECSYHFRSFLGEDAIHSSQEIDELSQYDKSLHEQFS